MENKKRLLKISFMGLNFPGYERLESAIDTVTPEIPNIKRLLYKKIKDACDLTTVFHNITDIYNYGKKISKIVSGVKGYPHIQSTMTRFIKGVVITRFIKSIDCENHRGKIENYVNHIREKLEVILCHRIKVRLQSPMHPVCLG